MKLFIAALIVLTLFVCASAQDDIADPVYESKLAGIQLPEGSYLVRSEQVPDNIKQMLSRIVSSDRGISQGESEVLVLQPSSDVDKLRQKVERSLKSAGWTYEISGEERGIIFFTAIKRQPVRKNLFGFWVEANGNLMLSMTEIFTSQSTSVPGSGVENTLPADAKSASTNAKTHTLSATDMYVNVMGNSMPAVPSFPVTAKKPGYLRGFVEDSSGRPLEGAYIGVRSTLNGGSYSGASGLSDAKGYYEIKLPVGAIHLYAAAYTIDHGDLRAAMSLHPVDGRLDSFASANGNVENFVLLSYGVADRDKASEQPNGASNYYGGAIGISYNLAEAGDTFAPPNYIKENSEIEITLVPIGSAVDGSSHSFVVRKNVGNGMMFNILNIPVGKYSISARLVRGGRPLFMKQSVRNKNQYGIEPKEAMGQASIIFEPASAQNLMTLPAYGSWTTIEINLYLSK